MPRNKQTEHEGAGSGGPFESAYHAVGDPLADAMVGKARLVYALMKEIDRRGLSQTAAAKLLGIPQSNLSRLTSGEFRSVTFDRLFGLLNRLGIGVRVTFGPEAEGLVVESTGASAGPPAELSKQPSHLVRSMPRVENG